MTEKFRVLADENIPYAEECYSLLGPVRLKSGRAMTREDLAETDILMIRSITKVNRDLVEGTPVEFVGTATIGTDHVDIPLLGELGIGFSSAPGCNANSVSEYILAALLEMAEKHGFTLEGKTLGIIGVGNVGSRVKIKAEAAGMNVILNDPPKHDETGDESYRPIEEIFSADIITLHVPLIKDGPYPTYHMADTTFFERMKGKGFINASRGSVVDEQAHLEAVRTGNLLFSVLDVWEHEPDITRELMNCVDIGTPHIAGYSFEGKINGTSMIYEAACRQFGLNVTWDRNSVLGDKNIYAPELKGTPQQNLLDIVRFNYDIFKDDAALREAVTNEGGAGFDRLRKEYRKRREFTNTVLSLPAGNHALSREMLETLKYEMEQ